MKKVALFVLIIGVALASCKSSKKAATTAFEPAVQQTTTTPQPKVFQVPEVKETPAVQDDKPISVRKESFTFTPESKQLFHYSRVFQQYGKCKKFQTDFDVRRIYTHCSSERDRLLPGYC